MAQVRQEAQVQQPRARTKAERKADTVKRLATDVHIKLATVTNEQEAHLVPLTFVWHEHEQQLLMGTVRDTPTAQNVARTGRARGMIGPDEDVVIVRGPASLVELDGGIDQELSNRLAALWTSPFDFRKHPDFVYILLDLEDIWAYRPGYLERTGRALRRKGKWRV